MSEPSEVATRRDGKKRGVGFPSMALADAVASVVLVGQRGPEHSQDAFAAYLGHATANSGAFRNKVAALRDWGLLNRGERERITLSQLGTDLVMSEADGRRDPALLVAAFESCRPFGMLFHDSAKGIPLDFARIRTTAVMRYGVASEQADKFVDVFVRSAEFAGLATTDGSSAVLRERESAMSAGPLFDAKSEVAPSLQSISQPVTASVLPTAAVPVALRQAWKIDGGEIEFVVRTAKPMPAEIYGLMAQIATTTREMVGVLGLPSGATSDETHSNNGYPGAQE